MKKNSVLQRLRNVSFVLFNLLTLCALETCCVGIVSESTFLNSFSSIAQNPEFQTYLSTKNANERWNEDWKEFACSRYSNPATKVEALKWTLAMELSGKPFGSFPEPENCSDFGSNYVLRVEEVHNWSKNLRSHYESFAELDPEIRAKRALEFALQRDKTSPGFLQCVGTTCVFHVEWKEFNDPAYIHRLLTGKEFPNPKGPKGWTHGQPPDVRYSEQVALWHRQTFRWCLFGFFATLTGWVLLIQTCQAIANRLERRRNRLSPVAQTTTPEATTVEAAPASIHASPERQRIATLRGELSKQRARCLAAEAKQRLLEEEIDAAEAEVAQKEGGPYRALAIPGTE